MNIRLRFYLWSLLAAATLFARVPGFAVYRAVQESLSRVHSRVGGRNAD